ncbi:ubiquitin thioesterase Otu1 [Danaus plexippus]|uniref:Ubiquitin thioesterase OTU n=1 Tax=Danaus plexippus plexippus TaxID=278856 RepID=A0A212EJZ1_DANPL|nr:ubiquitin thioesterase Otu1 [Danaus plexippus]OWR41790.1 cysteine-type peptidase [Danaus plexippus plexippus]
MTSLAFKVKSKNGQQILKDLTSESTVGELKMFLSSISDVSAERICVLCGYPPKPLDISNDNKKITDIGLKTGESLIVEEKSAPAPENKKPEMTKPVENGVSHETIGPCRPGILMKKVVPSDNSCLFTSIGFVLNGNIDTTVHTLMRQIIAMEVASDHNTYNEGVLGRPNAEYCAWIQQPSSWGGAIEVAILSRFYGLEMAVVDTLNAIINRFGEDKNYGQRVFLLFDGVHYDPLYLEQSDGGIQTIFPSEDMDIYREAEQLAKEAKSSRQFTDLNKFTLKCMICNKLLTGQVEAQKHAKETKHTNFGEV